MNDDVFPPPTRVIGAAAMHDRQPDDSDTLTASRRSDSARLDVHRPPIRFFVKSCGDTRIVAIGGELDVTGVNQVIQQCTDGRSRDVVVDLSDVSFMDCGGYRGFVASRTELALHDRTLAIVGAVGEPRRLLDLIKQVDPTGPNVAS